MKVVLAGYNVDATVLEQAEKAGVAKESLTPEVLSAAYARISRDPSDVGELRKAALEEVEKCRTSNRKIIFEMGHHSVAEHAVFNFDIVGISRLALEHLERFRLCSFTEKSQRYITLDHDFVMPEEIKGTPHENELVNLIEQQSASYNRIFAELRRRLAVSHSDLEETKKGRTLLDGSAKEDARYVTLLSTTGQLGLTVNARNLELMVRRFASSPLAEVRELGKSLYKCAAGAAPSLLIFTEPSVYDSNAANDLSLFADSVLSKNETEESPIEVRLTGHTENPDRIIAAALLHAHSNADFKSCFSAAAALSFEGLKELFQTALRHMEFFDSTLREFEHVNLNYELVISASAYAQLKRHRMSTQSTQAYNPKLGLMIPPSLEQAGIADELLAFSSKAESLYNKLGGSKSPCADYVLTNAHRRRMLISTNLRELYHIVRLREDTHAQWDIRNIAFKMRQLAEDAMPLGTLLLCGKDSYAERYQEVFGRLPSIMPPS